MLTPQGPQCDICDKMIAKEDEAAGKFYKFAFARIASKSDPKKPATLISCPGRCHTVLGTAIKLRDFKVLPAGRLRNVLARLALKYGARNLEVH